MTGLSKTKRKNEMKYRKGRKRRKKYERNPEIYKWKKNDRERIKEENKIKERENR
jgi:hypothetical protein